VQLEKAIAALPHDGVLVVTRLDRLAKTPRVDFARLQSA
jgi:DNA invertase Pin-like site-specific DNA recombinase